MTNITTECPHCANVGEHRFISYQQNKDSKRARYTCLHCGEFWTEGVIGKKEFSLLDYVAFYLSSRLSKGTIARLLLPLDNKMNKTKINFVIKRVEKLIFSRDTLPLNIRNYLHSKELTLEAFQSILDTISDPKQVLTLKTLLELNNE